MQRTLAGIQTNIHRKEALISEIALMAKTDYEDVALFVEKKDAIARKKTSKSRSRVLISFPIDQTTQLRAKHFIQIYRTRKSLIS